MRLLALVIPKGTKQQQYIFTKETRSERLSVIYPQAKTINNDWKRSYDRSKNKRR